MKSLKKHRYFKFWHWIRKVINGGGGRCDWVLWMRAIAMDEDCEGR
jgi:hypothetical protein